MASLVVCVGDGFVAAVHTVWLPLYSVVSVIRASVRVTSCSILAFVLNRSGACSVILFAHFSTYWFGSIVSPSSASLSWSL